MTPILLLIVVKFNPAAHRHARSGAGLLPTADYALSQRNTPQTFEHRAFPRFRRDIGGLIISHSRSLSVAGSTCRS